MRGGPGAPFILSKIVGAFCGLQQLRYLTHTVIRNVEVNFYVFTIREEQKEVPVHLFQSQNVVAILPAGFGKSLIYQLYATAKEMARDPNVVVLIVSPLKSITDDRDRDRSANWANSFHRFVNKRRCASAKGRSEMQPFLVQWKTFGC